jgi:hypothetical protein
MPPQSLPVFEAVVSKHMPMVNDSHFQDFSSVITASADTFPAPDVSFGTPHSLMLPSARDYIITGNRSTFLVMTPVMSGDSLPSQCTTDLLA